MHRECLENTTVKQAEREEGEFGAVLGQNMNTSIWVRVSVWRDTDYDILDTSGNSCNFFFNWGHLKNNI